MCKVGMHKGRFHNFTYTVNPRWVIEEELGAIFRNKKCEKCGKVYIDFVVAVEFPLESSRPKSYEQVVAAIKEEINLYSE